MSGGDAAGTLCAVASSDRAARHVTRVNESEAAVTRTSGRCRAAWQADVQWRPNGKPTRRRESRGLNRLAFEGRRPAGKPRGRTKSPARSARCTFVVLHPAMAASACHDTQPESDAMWQR